MPKALTIFGMVVAGLIGLAFAADLVLQVPFKGFSPMMDIGLVFAAGILGYLSWDAMREIR